MDKIGNTPKGHQQWNEQVRSIVTQRNGGQETTSLHNNVDEGYKQNRKEKDKQRNYFSVYWV